MSSASTATCGTHKSVKLVTEEELPGKQPDKAAATALKRCAWVLSLSRRVSPIGSVYGQIRRGHSGFKVYLPGKGCAF